MVIDEMTRSKEILWEELCSLESNAFKRRHIVTNIKLYVIIAVQKYKNMSIHLSFKFHSTYTGRYTRYLQMNQ